MNAKRWSLGLALCSLWIVSTSNAGQRRVDVGFGGLTFAPATATLNLHDQVTFVWVVAGHSVTNGTDPNPINDPNEGTIFDTGVLSSLPAAFSWKADRTGAVPYFCIPHFSFGMTAALQISASGVSVSSFRISEVQYNDASGHDRIEIANLGGDTGDLGRYRISINGTTSALVPLNSALVLPGPTTPGRVVIHTNEGTTGSTATNMFMAIGDLPATGSVALFAPNTVGTSLTDVTQIVDFVEWGATGQPNEATAIAAGLWTAGESVDPVPVSGNYDLAFCGLESQHGKSFWQVAQPNFRSQALCATPTQASTWGRIKLLYR
jgi:plastocyanin